MQLLLTILTTLLAGTLVVLVPGAGLLATMRLDRIVPPPLVPAAALALGLVPLAVLLSATLALHQPIEFVAIGLGLVVLACWSTLATREARTTPRGSRVRARARGWILPVRSLVAGEWMRGTPWPAFAVAVAGGVLALVVGFHAWNDSLYHIGQAQKLLALDEPTFSNTLQFPDATAHPGYVIPAWQEVIALTAFVSRVDPVTVSWILPGLTFPVSLLAFGGLGWAATRARGATSVVALAMLVVTISTLPLADAITNAMHPGVVGLSVLAPLVLAMLFGALWPERDRVAGMGRALEVPAFIASRASLFVAMVATAGLGMFHVSYLWVLGMGILGYYLVWLLRMPWPRDVVRRHLVTGAAIALVAATCVALLLPGLSNLETSGLDAKQELERNDSALYVGENDANLDALLRGDPAGAYHLRSDYLVLAGGLALLGLLATPLLLLAPRWPGGWYLAGAATLVLAIALSDSIFPRFVNLVTLDQARRIERVLPLVLALGVAALGVGALAAWLWRRGGNQRVAGAVVAIGAAAGFAAVADAVPALGGYAGERIVHPRVLIAILVALLVSLVLFVVLRVTRRELTSWTWPTHLLGRDAVTIAFLVLLVGATPVYARIGDVTDEQRLENLPIDMRTAEMRLFAPNVARELRKLPPGSIVLTDPRTRNSYVAMAIAPVYVVSSVPRHTALTPKNRVSERFERAMSFFEGDFDDGLKLNERIQLLRDEQVDAIVMHPFASAPIRKQLDRMPGVRRIVVGKNQQLYVIDRDRLPELVRPPDRPLQQWWFAEVRLKWCPQGCRGEGVPMHGDRERPASDVSLLRRHGEIPCWSAYASGQEHRMSDKNQHILIVEDEESISSFVKMYLEREGFQVTVAPTGELAMKALEEKVDLVTLDLMLPDMDGLEICRQVRATSNVPIIMLTARDEDIDKIVGLEVGADDYLTKPFNARELVARIKSILRRSNAPANTSKKLQCGEIHIDAARRECTVSGEQVMLAPKEFDLLWELLERDGEVLNREQLLEKVWGYTYAGDTRTVDVHVRQLRKKLGDACPIVTVWGSGYKVGAEVSAA